MNVDKWMWGGMAGITFHLQAFFFFFSGTIVCQPEVWDPAAEPVDCTLQEVKGPEEMEGTGCGGRTAFRRDFLSDACEVLRLCYVKIGGQTPETDYRVDCFMFACICTSLGG